MFVYGSKQTIERGVSLVQGRACGVCLNGGDAKLRNLHVGQDRSNECYYIKLFRLLRSKLHHDYEN